MCVGTVGFNGIWVNRMRKAFLAVSMSFCLSACFESPSDLLGEHANVIVRMEPIFSLSNQIYYMQERGKTVDVCGLSVRSDLKSPCKSLGNVSIERTSRGNYIVQLKSTKDYKYGIWFRTDESLRGQCFLWLGDGIVGNPAMSSVALRYGNTELFTELSSAVRRIATERPISRQQLLQIASAYESTLSPLTGEPVKCLGERTWIEPKSVEVIGDNRHLQQFEPGPLPPR